MKCFQFVTTKSSSYGTAFLLYEKQEHASLKLDAVVSIRMDAENPTDRDLEYMNAIRQNIIAQGVTEIPELEVSGQYWLTISRNKNGIRVYNLKSIDKVIDPYTDDPVARRPGRKPKVASNG